jgi:hypothetical protein
MTMNHFAAIRGTVALASLTAAIFVVACGGRPSFIGPERGRHRITISEIALSDSDFTKSALGNPRAIELHAYKDGADVLVGKLPGFRGPKQPGLTFEIDYEPKSRYEFKILETQMLTEPQSWQWSSTEPGNWIFEGRRTFGSGSSIEFRDEKVP